MSKRAGVGDFAQWADSVLEGTGWTAGTVRGAAQRGCPDLATAALADGFAAAARGLTEVAQSREGAA